MPEAMKLIEPYPLITLEWPDYRKRKYPFKTVFILLLGILFLILALGISYDIIMHISASNEEISHGLKIIEQRLSNKI